MRSSRWFGRASALVVSVVALVAAVGWVAYATKSAGTQQHAMRPAAIGASNEVTGAVTPTVRYSAIRPRRL